MRKKISSDLIKSLPVKAFTPFVFLSSGSASSFSLHISAAELNKKGSKAHFYLIK
jgi:hypothetical protein